MKARYTLVDLLRILANVSVVSHHLRGRTIFEVGFGVPLFLILMCAFAAKSSTRESFGAFTRRKGRFLLVPWMRWSGVFFVIFLMEDLLQGRPPLERWSVHALLYGGHVHFWFLPWAAVLIAAVHLLERRVQRFEPVAAALGLGIAAGATTLWVHGFLEGRELMLPYRGWLMSLPALGYGLAMARVLGMQAGWRRRGVLLALALIAVVVWWSDPEVGSRVHRRYAVAVPLVCLGLAWRPAVPAFLPQLASTSFGIYLVHPIPTLLLERLADPLAWHPAVHLLAVWVPSALLVLGLRRLRPRWPEAGVTPTPQGEVAR